MDKEIFIIEENLPPAVGILNRRKPIQYYINERGCWIFCSGSFFKNGYGKITRNRKCLRVHRYVYELLECKIPDDLLLRHSCDNKKCINPAHLLPGTNQDNADDMVARNRQSQGENHLSAKLTKEKVIEIISKYKLGISYRKLALEYNVSWYVIGTIIRGECWKDIPR